MNQKPSTVTRAEIARAANISEETVRKNQAIWGLNNCRSVASKRPAIFFREEASKVLIDRKVINKPL